MNNGVNKINVQWLNAPARLVEGNFFDPPPSPVSVDPERENFNF